MDLIKLPFTIAILILRELFALSSEAVAECQIARSDLDSPERNEKLKKLGITRVNGMLVFPDHSTTTKTK